MAQKRDTKQPKFLRPVHSFVANVDGQDVSYREDTDLIHEKDPILKRYPHLFSEIKPEARK